MNHALPNLAPSALHADGLPRPFGRAKTPLKMPLVLPMITGGNSDHGSTPTGKAEHGDRAQVSVSPFRAERDYPVRVLVTAYCLAGNTHIGTTTRDGIVAADPRVFAMNSEIDLSVAGRPAKRYRVEDTGLLIKGRIIDIWLPDCAEAINFGRKQGIATLATKIRR